ncbi:GGDEF domain-containing protein [Parashewanella curva]|uniref:GGDEF domain-containing protein n=1 Tax=Parashewanella curva TaxID=2338552 RepID=A0A3L8PXS8_9GAMM|nr:GGDEF domain-containing phosphodiesterase [Parashewanella curva]RLV59609.1 GGDEF domain-containing protein [Parashewanella curva]
MLILGITTTLAIALVMLCWVLYSKYRESNLEDEFISKLSSKIAQQIEHRTPLKMYDVPLRYRILYSAIDNFLKVIPPPTGLDKLTGLMNRIGLKSRLAMLMPVKKGYFVLLDIHRFRFVNNMFGFSLGDQLLKRFTDRLKTMPQRPRLMARMSGAEFFLYFEHYCPIEDLLELQQQLQTPLKINNTPISVKLKMAVLGLEEHYSDVSTMLKRLDLALKKSVTSPLLFSSYQAGDDRIQDRELAIIAAIPKALTKDEMNIVYQPKESLPCSGFSQVEALLRWEHPEIGFISPAEFIPLAERAGMIDIISHWVIEKVLHQQVLWRSAGLYTQVGINLSSSDLCCDNLVKDIKSALERHNLPGDCLSIELTESSLMEDTLKATETLHSLRDLGISIAIDDFGTGHSSLAYLKRLPIDEVKVDRSFLEDIFNDKASLFILETSISLPKKLGLDVTVEGVESRKVRELLLRMGVNKIQGTYYSEPLKPFELELRWDELSKTRIAELTRPSMYLA